MLRVPPSLWTREGWRGDQNKAVVSGALHSVASGVLDLPLGGKQALGTGVPDIKVPQLGGVAFAVEPTLERLDLLLAQSDNFAKQRGPIHRFGVFHEMHAVNQNCRHRFRDDHLAVGTDDQSVMVRERCDQRAAECGAGGSL